MNEPQIPIDPVIVPASPLEPPPGAFWKRAGAAVLLLLLVASLWTAWATQDRVRRLEQELVRRQQASQDQSGAAQLIAKQAQESAMESAAKVALLEAKLSEVSVQRGQLEDVIQSLSRSRDENIVGDIDAAVRVAQQQSALTGSAEPLVAALRQADERLARHNQPRLERVRRAIARDLDRVKGVGVTDIASLTLRLDELVRMAEDLPLLSQAKVAPQRPGRPGTRAAGAAQATAAAASAPADDWSQTLATQWGVAFGRVWQETKSLVRVTRIDHPDAVLMAPEQALFLRENLKLRLLNARLALLSRQFDASRADLHQVQAMLDRYFDRNSRRTVMASDLVKQVAASTHQAALPRPDETLASLSAAAAGR